MFFYSNVPLVDKATCPKAAHHNFLAKQFNNRLELAGPSCSWSIFYYADSIFLGMRNTATPGMPLGINPPEDEWWKIYSCIEQPTGETGEGNWPITLAGYPEGANVMNPLNAYIFGRVTAENKQITKMGPWAEGNLFDGLVQSSRAVLTNNQYWQDSFRQRGAIAPNNSFSEGAYKSWLDGDKAMGPFPVNTMYAGNFLNSSKTPYLPSPWDPVHVSQSLFAAGRSSDRYFREYASNTVYARYAPSVYGGGYQSVYAGDYRGTVYPSHGVLKRKNAAKDVLRWGLWVYAFYFRGSEHQRSLFCERKDWDAPSMEYQSTAAYRGEQTIGLQSVRTHGPLNICKVGFDFFKYYTRQNLLAPSLGWRIKNKEDSSYMYHDGIGNTRLNQFRCAYKFTIGSGVSRNNWLGRVNGFPRKSSDRNLASGVPSINTTTEVTHYPMAYENYDDIEIGSTNSSEYGKTLRFPASDVNDRSPNKAMLFKCSYLDAPEHGYGVKLNDPFLFVKTNARKVNFCLAGYYIRTSAVENPNLTFKLRIWRHVSGRNRIVHETIINRRYSYAINRANAKFGQGRRAYVYNKIFYFKNPPTAGKYRFEIAPVIEDNLIELPRREGGEKRAAQTNYEGRIKKEKAHDRVISFGNPYSNVVKSFTSAIVIGSDNDKVTIGKGYLLVPDGEVSGLSDGDAIMIQTGIAYSDKYDRIYDKNEGEKISYAMSGKQMFITMGTSTGGRTPIWLSSRQDSRLTAYGPSEADHWFDIKAALESRVNPGNAKNTIPHTRIRLFKLNLDVDSHLLIDTESNFFTATIEPAILLNHRPSFHDAYALLRVATEKQNPMNSMSSVIGHDLPGMGTVGHAFHDSNAVFRNYIKYGSAVNVFGSGVVPALRQKVSSNPIYESMRKFVSSCMRMVDRHQLLNYTIENGRGVFYFKRFAWMGLANRSKATVLRNMEPSVDPCGWFFEGIASRYGGNGDIDYASHAKFNPILPNKWYYVYLPKGGTINYNGFPYGHGGRFKGVAGKQNLENGSWNLGSGTMLPEWGAFEEEGIRSSNQSLSDIQGGTTNEWVMFMTSDHYNTGSASIYKPSVYSDIMGFLNNRCHHRSHEYERGMEDKYQMIRTELCRVPDHASTVPGPRLHIFLSKSSKNYNYIFNTNNPHDGNLHTYGSHGNFIHAYRTSCPPASDRPYKITSCSLVSPYGGRLKYGAHFNPSAIKRHGTLPAAQVVRVEIYPPLKGTGRLNVGPSGWAGMDPGRYSGGIRTEPYRTDENAVVEHLMHKYGIKTDSKNNAHTSEYFKVSHNSYNCNRNMIGDYAAKSYVREGSGYRPWGACYPRFYFLKLIPLVGQDSLLDVEPYAQMDFYMRAMCGQFVMPYTYYNSPGQVDSINWKYTELASRSAEEDPASYYYVDPREVQS